MSISFENSITKDNLMRAFAGESQARNRYTIAAAQAKKQDLQVIAAVFQFTAEQEREHASIFYRYLASLSGKNIQIDGAYPVDIHTDIAVLLRMAEHNEYEEHDDVYKNFADKAQEEGFLDVASSFRSIAKIEKLHGERFGKFAQFLENNQLFASEDEIPWMCLECGNVFYGTKVPPICPVCHESQGNYVRLDLAPFI